MKKVTALSMIKQKKQKRKMLGKITRHPALFAFFRYNYWDIRLTGKTPAKILYHNRSLQF